MQRQLQAIQDAWSEAEVTDNGCNMFPRIGTWGNFQGQQKAEVGEDVTAIEPRVTRNTIFTPKGAIDPTQEAGLGAHVGNKMFGWIRSEMAMRTLPKSMDAQVV